MHLKIEVVVFLEMEPCVPDFVLLLLEENPRIIFLNEVVDLLLVGCYLVVGFLLLLAGGCQGFSTLRPAELFFCFLEQVIVSQEVL